MPDSVQSFSRYIALYIDLLGQSDKLDAIPNPFEPSCLNCDETKKAFTATVENVRLVAGSFQKSFIVHETQAPDHYIVKD